ncbi:MAG TPA: phage holin family protein [Aggregatilineaceae bacterium]|nr:phage holin family protein [Aggregatilineaceae bacterium]
MRNFLLRLVINAIALAVTAAVLPGIHVKNDSIETLAIVALVFGIVNALVKPIFVILSCPLIILTLGLFVLVIDGIMLLLTDALSGGRFTVDGLGWAILGSLVMNVLAQIVEAVLGVNNRDKDNDKIVIISR